MTDPVLKVPLVLFRRHGGFHLTEAIVMELRRRGWSLLEHVTEAGQSWYVSHDHLASVRQDPVLLDVVRGFEQRVKAASDEGQSWREVEALNQVLLDGLAAVEVTLRIDIEDYDGLETVRVCGGLW